MKVSYPRMGTSHIAFKQLMNHIGYEAVNPPKPSEQTLSLGVKYAPEFACIPFKVLLGTYLEVAALGTEMIITSGGVGPCRAGLYGMLHEKILRNLGYDIKMVIFDPPLTGLRDFIGKLKQVMQPVGTGWLKLLKEIKTAWHKLMVLDEIEILSHEVRPYEITKGQTSKIFDNCLELVDAAETDTDIDDAKATCVRMLSEIPQDKSRIPLKIGLIGEIYVVLEPFMNLEVEKTLGEMGVLTNRSIYLTAWTRDNVWTGTGEWDVRKAARPFLNQHLGGHGVNSVGETVLYSQHNFDGVVQLAPFTCIPEIVAKSILPKVSKEKDIPVLTITIDEQTGKAGVQTRLEAFIDLLLQKRELREGLSSARVSGY